MNIGDAIGYFRRKRRITAATLGAQLGISPSGVSKYETGRTEPTPSVLRKIAEVLGVDIQDLLEYPKRSHAAPAAAHSPSELEGWYNHSFLPVQTGGRLQLFLPPNVCPDHNAPAFRVPDAAMVDAGIHKSDIVLFSKTHPLKKSSPAVFVSKNNELCVRVFLNATKRQTLSVSADRKFELREWKRTELSGVYPVILVIRSMLGGGIFTPEQGEQDGAVPGLNL